MPTTCHRCRASTTMTTMSKFNTDTICMSCEADERLAPGYREACRAESDAVRSGDYNFPGIGLSPADTTFLAERRKARGAL
jgi:hypothetical protein